MFVILGGSGSGKSTLMKQLIGLLPLAAGRIEIAGRTVTGPGAAAARADVQRQIGVMFQSGALFGSMSLLENVMLPLEMFTDLPPDAREAVARVKLGLVGLADAAPCIRRRFPAGWQNARQLPGPWRSIRRCCSWMSRRPGSIRSPPPAWTG